MVPIILILPLLAAILLAAILDRKQAKYAALAASVISLALLPFIGTGTYTYGWIGVGNYQLSITFSVGAVNLLLLFMVLAISPFIFLYSFGYIKLPSEQKRYYIEMLGFETAMVIFAMAGGFIVFFIAWEFLSVASYLLIGFYNSRDRAAAAARKAITIVMIGDILLFAAIVLFLVSFGTLNFGPILSGIEAHSGILPGVAVFLLTAAVFTKSAQFPFHEWLSDAMEGPTTVSALLHSATMVKAGVFAVIILLPIFAAYGYLQPIIIVGVITAVLAALNAMKEMQIKKVIAYSTVQELALMLVAVCGGALAAGIYFFLAQGFYKVLLFFSAGSAMEATGKERLDEIGGVRSNRMIFVTTLFGVLAIAGFIPFDGFFSNVGLGSAFGALAAQSAFEMNFIIYLVMLAMGLATSFYMFRWFFTISKKADKSVEIAYDMQPRSMKYSMLAMAAFTLIAGAWFVYAQTYIPNGLAYHGVPGYANYNLLSINVAESVIETLIAVAGLILAYLVYARASSALAKTAKRIGMKGHQLPQTTFIFNAVYKYFCLMFIEIADGFYFLDLQINELFDRLGHAINRFGYYSSFAATGKLNYYVALFAAGLFVILVVALSVIL